MKYESVNSLMFSEPRAIANRWLQSTALAVLLSVTIVGCSTNQPRQEVDHGAYDRARKAFIDQDYKRASLAIRPLAEQGHAKSQYALGYLYRHGLGVPKDDRKALIWIKKSATQGYAPAQKALTAFESGTSPVFSESAQAANLPTPSPTSNPTIQPKPTAQRTPPKPARTITPSYKQKPAVRSQPSTATQTAAIRDESWIKTQNPGHFTIQIVSSMKSNSAKKFIQSTGITRNAAIYPTSEDKVWVAIVYGSYESYGDARKALESLSPTLRSKTPFVRKFENIQSRIP